VLLATLLLALAAATREHGPIPLYQPELLTPDAAAGAGVRPLVRAKLKIDTAGKVAGVEITAVEPSSPLDDVFRDAARAALSAWRFAAAEKDGQAVPSETSVALQFDPPVTPYGGKPPALDVGMTGVDRSFESLRYQARARILAMLASERRKLADRTAAQAEALLKPGQRVTAADEWFEVVTDYGGQKQADTLLHNAGATYAALYKLLGERIPPRPREDRIRIYVFETASQYRAFVAESAPFEGSDGVYSAAGIVATHAQHRSTGYFILVLLHETTHAFMDRHVTRAGVQLPRWLDEGLAEYVGMSDIKDRKIVPGGHAKRQELIAVNGMPGLWQTESKVRADQAKRAQRQKKALTLEELVSAGPETFYGKDYDLYYSQGWLAVHFLRHGRPEWADGAFPKFLLYAAEGYPADQALRTAYGSDASELEAAYQRYVTSF
jgi:hypothetical protein